MKTSALQTARLDVRQIPSSLSRRHWLIAGAASLLPGAWAHAELADLRQKGSLKVALYRNHMPFSDAAAQGAVGVDADLAQALAQRLQLGVQWLPFEAGETMNDDLRNMVWRGHYLGYGPADVMMQVPIDRGLIEGTRQVEFLMPYYRHRLVWLSKGVPSLTDLRTLSLDGVSLAAEIGTAAGAALLGYGSGKFRDAVKMQSTGLEAARGVVAGKWQAAYVTQAQAETALKDVSGRGEYIIEPAVLPGTPVNGWAVGLAIKSGQPQLAAALNTALKSLMDDGSLDKIWSRHGLTLLKP